MPKIVPKNKKAKKIKKAESASIIQPVESIEQGLLSTIIEACGSDSAQLLGSDGLSIKIKGVISTRAATIDAAIGRGGVPRGRLTIVHGDEGSGKTTLALEVAAETQHLGGVVLYMDKEYKLDPEYAAKLGVDVSKMIISQPPYLEKSYEIWDKVIDRAVVLREKGLKAPISIFLDSMNAAIAKAQYDGEWDDKHYAPAARVHSDNLPKLMPKISKEDVTMLWISQVREDIGVRFGNPDKIAGGRAPRFYASLIMDVKRSTAVQEDGEKQGNEVIVECIKNQISPPFRKGKVVIRYGEGFDKKQALIEQAVKDEIMIRNGSFYKYKDETIGHGIDDVKKQMSDDLFYEIMREIEKLRCWDR